MIIIVILNVTRFSYFLVLRCNVLPVWNIGNKSTKGSFLRARGVSAWLVISYFVRVRQTHSQGPFRTEAGQLIQWIIHYLTSKIILWKYTSHIRITPRIMFESIFFWKMEYSWPKIGFGIHLRLFGCVYMTPGVNFIPGWVEILFLW